MFDCITALSPSSITVLNAEGHATSLPIRLTPKKRYLTHTTQKRILATGFMVHFDPLSATDFELIKAVMRYIRRAVLALSIETAP